MALDQFGAFHRVVRSKVMTMTQLSMGQKAFELTSERNELLGPGGKHRSSASAAMQHVQRIENGSVQPSRSDVAILEQLASTQGAVYDIAIALGSPTAIPPRRRWRHNFQPPRGPIWVWIRPTSGTTHLAVRIHWGPLRLAINFDSLDADGVFVSSPYSVTTPALHVELDEPGWVDFGRGVVPDALGVPVLSGMSEVGLREHVRRFVREFTEEQIQKSFGGKRLWVGRLNRFLGVRPELVHQLRQVANDPSEPGPISPWEFDDDEAWRPPDRSALTALREARILTIREVAEIARSLDPEVPDTHSWVSALETRRFGKKQVARLPILDVIYGADGRLCGPALEQTLASEAGIVSAERTRFTIPFPRYFAGDVWFTITPLEPGSNDVIVVSAPWKKLIKVRETTTYSFRRAESDGADVEVFVPMTCRITYGVGWNPKAVDINLDWVPIDPAAKNRLFTEFREVWLIVFGKTEDDLSLFNRVLAKTRRGRGSPKSLG